MYSSTPVRTLRVILEAVLKSKSENGLGQEEIQSLLEPRIKRRGDYLWKLDTSKIAQTSDEMRKYDPKGDESRVPIEMWDRRE